MNAWAEIVNELGFEPPDHSVELNEMMEIWDMSNHPLITPASERENLMYKTEMMDRRKEKLKLFEAAGYDIKS